MTKNLDDIRLSDIALEQSKKTSFFVERQFPSIYREDGRELIELVKSYYRFLEEHDAQSIYNIRRIYEYRNIDSTLERMLVFFKNKFLNGLLFEEDIRFIVKNILDLYRRKGSKEGIELFFKMFFDSEVSIYFPSQDMFKPSTSLWKIGSFIQLYSTNDFNRFDGIVNKKIYGDKSNAEAFVDELFFVNVNNAYVPILFISGTKGQFIGFDTIYSLDPVLVSYGRVYGSLRSVEIDLANPNATGGNVVGDTVEILSQSGFGAKARISKVSSDLSGEISFSVEDGNYGYTITNTDVLISDQSAFFDEGEGVEFIINERVRQIKNSNTEVFGTVIGRKSDSIGLYIDYRELDNQILFVNTSGSEYNIGEEVTQTNSFDVDVFGTIIAEQEGFVEVELDKTKPGFNTQRYFFEKSRPVVTTERVTNISKLIVSVEDDYFFESGLTIDTVSRETNIEKLPLFVTDKNTTARADIGTIKNTETISLITDLIENFLDVPLSSNNYSEVPPALVEMSGTLFDANTEPNLDTPLNIAFVPETIVIGEIETLSNINPGIDHLSDVFVLARENLLSKFNLQNQILNVTTPSGVVLFEGDLITQTKTIQTFEGDTIQTTVKGEIVSISGNDIKVKQRTFESFVIEEPIFKEGSDIPISVNSRGRDLLSAPLGLNAKINGDVETILGKIQEVQVFDSGIGYEDNSVVKLLSLKRKQQLLDQLQSDLNNFIGLKIEFDEIEDVFGISGTVDSIQKRWNLSAIATALLEGGQGVQPQRDLFVNTIVPETALALGDVDLNGDFEFQDYQLFLEYVTNINNTTWRNDNELLVSYIEMIMIPFMEENYVDYQDYGIFTVEEFDFFRSRQEELLDENIDENITSLQEQIETIDSIESDAIGIASARSQGITEGRWKTFESHINQEKVIQDSFFYQDYSYEITTDIPASTYEAEYRNQMHPSGMKLFTKFGAVGFINSEINIFSNIRLFDEIVSEPNVSTIEANGFQYIIT